MLLVLFVPDEEVVFRNDAGAELAAMHSGSSQGWPLHGSWATAVPEGSHDGLLRETSRIPTSRTAAGLTTGCTEAT